MISFLVASNAVFEMHPLWLGASETDLLNAKEGLEKYLMSKMYKVYFQPKHSEDALHDEVILNKTQLLAFLEPQHLEIPERCVQMGLLPSAADPSYNQFQAAGKELQKMDTFRGPRDKVICILNASKIITSKIMQAANCEGADHFLPILIYVILKSNPPFLFSNLEFISRFRNPDALRGEAYYYFTHMMGAVRFIEKMDGRFFILDTSSP